MKTLDLAFKDLSRNLRNAFGVVMMVVAPLLISGLLYLAFGNVGGEKGLQIPVTRVQIANLDQTAAGVGQTLVSALSQEGMAQFFEVTEADEAAARAAVEQGDADIALIIPAQLTERAYAAEQAAITILKSDDAAIGASILEGVANSFLDGLAGAKVTADVIAEQYAQRGVAMPAELIGQASQQYAQWSQSLGATMQDGELDAIQMVSPKPAESTAPDQNVGKIIMANVVAGMMIFFVFFTGASTAESIIKEQEEGTLARLFTTPTPQATILGGKFVAVFFTLIVQVVILLISARLLFDIWWGELVPLVLVSISMIVAAAGFGVFVMSFVQNTRQSGPVMGGVLTITGMVGGLMTTGIQNIPEIFDIVNLFTPQGWALRGWQMVLAGESVGAVLGTVLVTLAWGLVLFAVGVTLMRKRFA
ncbi:MAG: ABC transporter permease [Chloroflexi bacterium]|jgi:ABC-2 type transport system permease protein|nr:ABC transporter permease [Chloroflexota bacterium]